MNEKEKTIIKAKLFISDKNPKRALMILTKALEKYKEDPAILTELSVVYELLEDFDKSEESLEKAIRLDPNFPRARYIKGIDCQNGGDLKQAEKEFEIAIENYPKYPDKMRNEHLSEAHTNLGTVFYLQGKKEEAIGQWRLAVSYDANNTEARNNLSEFSNEINEKIDIGEDYEYLIDRGISLSEQDRLIEAIRVLKKAESIKPDNALIHYNIGLVYGRNGDFTNAQKHLEKFLELEPKHQEAPKIKELVKKIKRGDFSEDNKSLVH